MQIPCRKFSAALAATTLLLAGGPLAAQDFCVAPACDTQAAGQAKQAAKPNPPRMAEPAAAMQNVVQDYDPKPAIWRLADDDTTIYMFGTFHILPEGFRWRTGKFDSIVREVDQLVVETSDADAQPQIAMVILGMMIENDDRPTISSRLDASNREKWAKLAGMAGTPVDEIDQMPPFLAIMGLGVSMSEMEGSLGAYGVETVLEAEFAESGRPVGSIENAGEVMAALLNIDDADLIEELNAELAEWDGKSLESFTASFADDAGAEADEAAGEKAGDSNDPFRSEHLWAKGEMEPMGPQDFGENAFGEEAYRALLTDRNRAWARWLDKRLHSPGKILLAVGAGHFAGDDSVLKMLAERGLKADRIQ